MAGLVDPGDLDALFPAVGVDLSNNQDIDGILWGYKWKATALTYAFPDARSDYGGYQAINNFQAFNADQRGAVVEILNDISSFTNLMFTPGSHEGATLRFAEATTINYSNNNTVLVNTGLHSPGGRNSAEANPPEEGFNGGAPTSAKFAQGDSWFNQMNYNTPTLGTFAHFSGLMHEIGHNLGLKHGHALGSAHGVAFPALPANHDSFEYSVMTYAQFVGDPDLSNDNALQHPTTYMQDDIAALQYLYGGNFNFHSEDNLYKWSPATGEMSINGVGQGASTAGNYILMTVWDGGGIDTYDFSNYHSHLRIDLRPGLASITHRGQLANLGTVDDPHLARGSIYNALQYQNDPRSLIENAIGGSGIDRITGNTADNKLDGRADNDTLIGLAGNDALIGGTGADRMMGGDDDDTYYVDDDRDQVVETQGSLRQDPATGAYYYAGGTDLVVTYVSSIAPLAAFVENLTYVGGESATLIGNGLDNVIIGGAHGDTLRALAGNDTLNGGTGADRMVGGEDDDTYYVDNVGDQVIEAQGPLRQDPFTGAYYYAGGNDTVMTTIASPKQLAPFVENLIYLGATQATLAGNKLDNIIAGGSGNDRIAGFAGKDTMRGGAGADYMAGGDDDDTYYVDDAGDQVVEVQGSLRTDPILGLRYYAGGDDTVMTTISSTGPLAAYVENLIYIGDTNATLIGNEWHNTIKGLGGDDTLIGNAGADVLDGGLGTDTADYSASAAGVTVNLETGVGRGGDAEGDTLINIEHAIGSAFDDTFRGGAVRGQFIAGDGNDTMIGGSIFDWFEGGNGNDTFTGTGGQMAIIAGDGDDTMIGSLDSTNYFDGGLGDDIMTGGNTVDYIADMTGGSETMHGGAGDDVLDDFYGHSQLFGEDGNDFVAAAGGFGLLDGGAGDDYATAANGDYMLVGGEGDDTLEFAGTGSANYTGGAGADIFTYRVTSGSMLVTDFEDGVDHIYLWDHHYNGNVSLESLTIADSAEGAVISWNGISEMMLAGITSSQLTEQDFVT